VNKYCKLPDEYQQIFKWIMMQMIQLMPDSIMVAHQESITVIIEICGIIQSIAQGAKNPKEMQKIAGDVEAIDKICEILLVVKI
jgi:hypothetical protein